MGNDIYESPFSQAIHRMSINPLHSTRQLIPVQQDKDQHGVFNYRLLEMVYCGILELSLTLFIYSSIPQVSDAYWGGSNGGWGGQYGLGGFHSGYGHQGYGYGSGICSGARQRQGAGTTYSQPSTNYAYNNNNNNNNEFSGYNGNGHGYYQDPVQTPQRTGTPNYNNNFDYRINISPSRSRPTPAPATCDYPNVRDSNIFEQQCIFPRESAQRSCTSQGFLLPSGTTAVTSCKSPQYYSDSGEVSLEICTDGTWFSDRKTLSCKSNTVVSQPSSTPQSYVSPDQVVQYVKTPQVGEKSSMSAGTNEPLRIQTQDYNRQPSWIYEQPKLSAAAPQNSQTSEPVQPVAPYNTPVSQPQQQWNYNNTNSHELPPEYSNRYPSNFTSSTMTTSTQRPFHIDEIDWRVNSNTRYSPIRCSSLPAKDGVILECLTKSIKNSATNSGGYMLSISECQEPQAVGTEATYKCKMYYEPITGITTQYRKCKENGMWSGSDEGYGCKLECGKSNPGGRLPLITFGETTILGQWPWHASLFIRDREDFSNACGGTLISRKAVLTAAHCVTLHLSSLTRDLDDIRVDLGRYYREKNDPYVQKLQVEKIVTHSAYNPFMFESDIAILILKDEAKIGFHVRPICFPKSQNAAFDEMQLEDGSFATVVGFGVDETGASPDELRSAKIQIIGYRECIESFQEGDTGAILAKSTTFCAGNKNGTNVCRGDSGSGAFFAVKTSSGSTHWYIQGIVSLGINVSANDNKCDPKGVSIFTRVSPYSDWINRVLSENEAT